MNILKKILPFLALTFLVSGYWIFDATPIFQKQITIPDQVEISEDRVQHILYGSERGGGHLHGINKPCKSEFPENWTPEKIISTVKNLAANDNVNWHQGRNGYFVGEKTVDDIDVRIVLSRDRSNIITAYPTNVTRNPCPDKPD